MAEDWSIDVKKYVPGADDRVIAGIVRYCGIALYKRDSSLVSFTDPIETGRVRENFLKKKLALTDPDEALDAAIAAVGQRMAGDPTRNRVTIYYLLAEHYGMLGMFLRPGEAALEAAPAIPAVAAAPVIPAVAAAPVIPELAAAPVMAAAGPPAAAGRRGPMGAVPVGAAAVLLPVLLLLGIGALVLWIVTRVPAVGPAVAMVPAAAPVAAAMPAPVIPAGAGVIAAETEGKPMVSVYFDTASAEVTPDFAAAAAPVKAWVDTHPGARLAVSGYNDPRGDAALNAELSKNRASNVAAALAALGIDAGAIDLVKPAETSDSASDLAGARRVEVTVE